MPCLLPLASSSALIVEAGCCSGALKFMAIKLFFNFILKPQAWYYPIPISAISNCTNLPPNPKQNTLNEQKEEENKMHSGFYLAMRD